jgi:hypothetical protein
MIGRWTASWLLGATCLALAGCVPLPPPGPPPVPPLPAETMDKPPPTAEPLIWQPGHWNWTGGGYAWAPGEFVSSAGHGVMWMPGYWGQAPYGGYVWQPAHWM